MKKNYALLIYVIGITFLVLIPTLRNGWTNLDDDIYILENTLIRDLSWNGIKNMFTTFHINGSYNPLVLLSWAVDYQFAALSPWRYHIMNLILHLCNIALVFYLAQIMSKNSTVAIGTSLLFGIHPMHVEAIAWVTARKELMYTTFYIAGLIAYHSYSKKNNTTRSTYHFAVSFLFYVLSLLSKGSAVTFPLILLLFDYLNRRKVSLKLILEKIPFLILSVIFTYVAIKAQKAGHALQHREFYSIWDSLSTGFYGYLVYLVKLVLPYRLSVLHPYPTPSGTPNPWFYWLSALPILAIAIYGFTKIKSNKTLVFGFGFFFITLIPVIQVLSFAVSETADRFSYLPYFSLFYLLSIAYVWLREHSAKFKSATKMISLVFICFLSLKTFAYSQIWKNSDTLLTQVIKHYPNYSFPYENRGAYRLENDQLDLAFHDCKKAIELDPKSMLSYYNLGIIFEKKDRPKEALKWYDKALEMAPNNLSVRQNRGILLTKLGRLHKALDDFNFSIESNPKKYSFYINRAFLFKEMKAYDLAVKDAQTGLLLNKKSSEAYYLLGLISKYQNRQKEGLAFLSKALEYNPNMANAHGHIGDLYYGRKNMKQALQHYNKAIKLNINKFHIYINRGVILLNQNKLDQAILDFSEAEKIEQDNYLVHFNRAIAHRLQTNYELALEDITHSLALKSDHKASLKEKELISAHLLNTNTGK